MLSAMPRSSMAFRSLPTCPSCSTMPSAYSVRAVSPGGLRRSAATWVRRCIRVLLYQQKNGLPACALPLDVVDGRVRGLVVDRLHPLLRERAGVLDRLLADAPEPGIDGRVVPVRGLALHHAARAEHPLELGVARVRPLLRLLLGVQVVEVAEELVEPVDGRQKLVQVAEVVLAELAGGVAVVLEQLGDGRVFLLQARPATPARRPCESPVRNVHWPVMNDDRPAVQLCSA